MKSWRSLALTVLLVGAVVWLGMGLAWGAPRADQIVFAVSTDGKTLVLTPNVPAKLRVVTTGPNTATGIAAIVVNGAPDFADFSVAVTLTPGPNPGPNPNPNPQPDPQPNPIPGALGVLIVYEQDDLGTIPVEQSWVLTNVDLRKYVVGHCAKDSKGKVCYKAIDKDSDVSKLDKAVQAWFTEAKTQKLPWMIASNGKSAYKGPLPADAKATIAKLQTLGGK